MMLSNVDHFSLEWQLFSAVSWRTCIYSLIFLYSHFCKVSSNGAYFMFHVDLFSFMMGTDSSYKIDSVHLTFRIRFMNFVVFGLKHKLGSCCCGFETRHFT